MNTMRWLHQDGRPAALRGWSGGWVAARLRGVLCGAVLAGAGVCGVAAADPFTGLQPGLGTLPLLGQGATRSVTAENPTGGKGMGGMAIPNPADPNPAAGARAADDLGQGWKVRPFLRINAGETAVLMDVKGPGVIQHMWLVENIHAENMGRGMVIRFYWDNEEQPSVECPALEFFAVGHGRVAPVNSLAVTVNPRNALSCFWPMPFHQRARVTLTNEGTEDNLLVAYQITYVETPVPAGAGTFHAQFRQARTADQNPYTILDGVTGRGRYVGTFLAWTQMERGWFGEGEVKFYLDGDDEFPTICGTGTEDYFLASFGFPAPYSTAYAGSVLPSNENADPPQCWSVYRWHIQDPVNFGQDLRVTIQALGWGPKYRLLKQDMIASVAYWYQAEPHAPFPKLPGLAERLSLTKPEAAQFKGAVECEGLALTATSPDLAAGLQPLSQFGDGWSGNAHLWVQAKQAGDFVELAIPALDQDARRITLHATKAPDYGIVRFTVNGTRAGADFDGHAGTPVPSGAVDLGVHQPRDGKFILRAEVLGANPAATGDRFYLGLDAVVLDKPSGGARPPLPPDDRDPPPHPAPIHP